MKGNDSLREMANTVCTKVLGPASLSSIMSEAGKDAEISSLKNLYEKEKQIVARIWKFLPPETS